MPPDTNSPTPIDPQLTADATRLTAPPLTVLPTRRARDDGEADDDDGERNVGSEKRQKLNLWKCKQCREARKKVRCFYHFLSFVAFRPYRSLAKCAGWTAFCYCAGFAEPDVNSDSAQMGLSKSIALRFCKVFIETHNAAMSLTSLISLPSQVLHYLLA